MEKDAEDCMHASSADGRWSVALEEDQNTHIKSEGETSVEVVLGENDVGSSAVKRHDSEASTSPRISRNTSLPRSEQGNNMTLRGLFQNATGWRPDAAACDEPATNGIQSSTLAGFGRPRRNSVLGSVLQNPRGIFKQKTSLQSDGPDPSLFTDTSSSSTRSAIQQALRSSSVDPRKAIQEVRRGGHLIKLPSEKTEGIMRSSLRQLVGLLKRPKNLYFVVPDTSGHSGELRWYTSAEARELEQDVVGHVLMSDVRYVTVSALRVDEEDTGHHDFRVICADRVLKLRAPNRETMEVWSVALLQLAHEAHGSALRIHREPDAWMTSYIGDMLDEVQLGGRTVQARDFMKLLARLKIHITEDYAQAVLDEFDTDKGLTPEESSEVVRMLLVKHSLLPWFEKYAVSIESFTDGELTEVLAMSPDRYELFLEIEQGQTNTGDAVEKDYFHGLKEPHVHNVDGKTLLTEAGFSYLLTLPTNCLFDPGRSSRVFQNMQRPLSHYWIASSHNTYLESGQLVGRSSLDQYVDVLLRGCRCVEIDCWDGDDGEPMVTHGWTATSRLRFREVIRVCKEYAFISSEYPLILSFEMHCSPAQQTRMAHILVEILGDVLLTHRDDTPELAELITPEEAKFKIIVKAKTKKPNDRQTVRVSSAKTSKSDFNDVSTAASSDDEPIRKKKKCRCRFMLCCCRRRKRRDSRRDLADDASRSEYFNSLVYLVGQKLPQPPKESSKFRKTVSSRATVTGDTKIDYANVLLNDLIACGCTSLSEVKAKKVIDENGIEEVRGSHRHRLVRVYPQASRIHSTNYDPMPFWLAGVQMVALNYQTLDKHVLVNEGLFSNENGRCGYVLKPAGVRSSSSTSRQKAVRTRSSGNFDGKDGAASAQEEGAAGSWQFEPDSPKSPDKRSRSASMSSVFSGVSKSHCMVSHKSNSDTAFPDAASPRTVADQADDELHNLRCTLELTVLSGHMLPKLEGSDRNISPMVRISMCGAPEDCRTGETRCIVDNGFNPRWHELFVFQVSLPSVAQLVFEVLDVSRNVRQTVAAAAFPFNGVRDGIRWVPLRDLKHQVIDQSGLLLEVRIRGPWAALRRHQTRLRNQRVNQSRQRSNSLGSPMTDENTSPARGKHGKVEPEKEGGATSFSTIGERSGVVFKTMCDAAGRKSTYV
jgi:hypothetical protein